MIELKVARIRKGLTQEQLAELIGTKKQHISMWEKGKHKPTLENLKKLANALDIQIDELIK